MENVVFGNFKKVEIRKVWATESSDFTPWLADNINRLNTALGLDLEVVDTEVPVGDFRLDILCKDVNSGKTVVIENMFGRSDHDHIGKAWVYSAGMNADIIIWIAEQFRGEHISAIRRMNNITSDEYQFWAVEVGVQCVEGTNYIMPQFNTVVRPSNWDKRITTVQASTSDGNRSRRSNFKFSMVGLKPGDEVKFLYDDVVVKVADDSHVEYNGELFTTSRFCEKFMPDEHRKPSGAYCGPSYFTYNGKNLYDWRMKLEQNA